MSDLKHMSKDELRNEIKRISSYRGDLKMQFLACEAEADRLLKRAGSLRKKHHDVGQREAWARIYLARMD